MLGKHGRLVCLLLGFKINFEHLKRLLEIVELSCHLVFLLFLVRCNLFVLGLLLLEVLEELHVFLLGGLETVTGIVSEFFDQLEPLNGFGFNFTVVTLHDFQIAAESVELGIEKAF